MDRKEIVKTYFTLMAAAWAINLEPRLNLEILEGTPTLTLEIECFIWALVDANILTLTTLPFLLLLPQTNSNKWFFAVAFFLQCIWRCIQSTFVSLLELQTFPAMLAAVNYFPMHFKMIIVCGMQLVLLVEVAVEFFYTLAFEN